MMTTERRRTIGAGATLGAAVLLLSPTMAQASTEAGTEVEWPEEFTSAYTVMATPDEVIDADGEVAPGEEGATGDFMFWINSEEEVICYEITLEGVTGGYESPALTATHIHEAAAGEPGPPRLAFPNPEPIGDEPRTSSGCMAGPFMTGVEGDDGADTGEGFSLAEIEANPAGFTGDSHTEEFTAGVVRGQLMQVPLDGVETGGGGMQQSSSQIGVFAGAGVLAVAGVSAFMLVRRNQAA